MSKKKRYREVKWRECLQCGKRFHGLLARYMKLFGHGNWTYFEEAHYCSLNCRAARDARLEIIYRLPSISISEWLTPSSQKS